MPYVYGNNGFSFGGYVDETYVAAPGEIIVDEMQTDDQLLALFPLMAGIMLSDARARRLMVLSAACQLAISGNYESSALGSAHTYPSAPTDQSNLHTACLAAPDDPTGWTFGIWCSNGAVWSFTNHTHAEIQQLVRDYSASLQGFQAHWASLVTLLNAAATIPDINAINW